MTRVVSWAATPHSVLSGRHSSRQSVRRSDMIRSPVYSIWIHEINPSDRREDPVTNPTSWRDKVRQSRKSWDKLSLVLGKSSSIPWSSFSGSVGDSRYCGKQVTTLIIILSWLSACVTRGTVLACHLSGLHGRLPNRCFHLHIHANNAARKPSEKCCQ